VPNKAQLHGRRENKAAEKVHYIQRNRWWSRFKWWWWQCCRKCTYNTKFLENFDSKKDELPKKLKTKILKTKMFLSVFIVVNLAIYEETIRSRRKQRTLQTLIHLKSVKGLTTQLYMILMQHLMTMNQTPEISTCASQWWMINQIKQGKYQNWHNSHFFFYFSRNYLIYQEIYNNYIYVCMYVCNEEGLAAP